MQNNIFEFAKIYKQLNDLEKQDYKSIKRQLWSLAGSMIGKYNKENSDKLTILTGRLATFERKMTEKYGPRQAL